MVHDLIALWYVSSVQSGGEGQGGVGRGRLWACMVQELIWAFESKAGESGMVSGTCRGAAC